MVKPRRNAWLRACLMLAVVASCRTPKSSEAISPSDQLRELVEERRYHEAYVLIDVVMEELKDVDEEAVGCEYSMLLSGTVGTGRSQWWKILADPKIALHHKVTLVEEIHEAAVRGALNYAP